jgi:hypothetical protein
MNRKKPGMESDADAKKTSENRKKIFATALTLFTETGILRHPDFADLKSSCLRPARSTTILKRKRT